MSHTPDESQQPDGGYQPPQYNPQQQGDYQPGSPQGQYYPPQQQQPPKKKGGFLKWGLGCLGLIVVVIVLAVACTAIAAGGGGSDDGAAETSRQGNDSGTAQEAGEADSGDEEGAGTILMEVTASGEGTVLWGADGGTNTESFTGSWSKEVPEPEGGMMSVTVSGDILDESSTVTCTMTIDGEIVDEAEGSGAAGGASCMQPLF